jgi:hypothetical protein
MTLARTALRLAALTALKGVDANGGPTIARNRVYDSRISDFSPETFPDDAKPTVVVLTDEDEGDALSRQNGGPPFKRMIDLVFEFAMVQGFDVPVEEGGTAFVPGYPATDAEHEASLDLLEFQIVRRLADDLDPLCALFRSFTRVWKHDCHRQVLDEQGVKIAARLLTWTVEVTDDQVKVYNLEQDATPTGLDLLPDPLKRVAKALPAGLALDTCNAIAAALTPPLTANPLHGVDMTVADVDGQDPFDMFNITVEVRSALDVVQVVTTGPTVLIDYAKGAFQNLILASNVSAISIINWPSTGKTGRLILQITNTGAFTLNGWPTGTMWSEGGVPVVTPGAGKRDILVLTTGDGGATIFGNIVGQDYR